MIKPSLVWKGILIGVTMAVAAMVIGFFVARYLGVSENIILPIGTETDGVSAWQTVTIGGVVTFEIPKTCKLDSGAGSSYLYCPTAENDQPLAEMVFSTDGSTVNVRRYENLETPYWDHIIASMKIVQPMTRDITINVEK